ncbi:type VII secretion-associated serine protease mycosin [Dactylosporangium vinaceum]|uniref:Type VII secretion-associated serine protease mycosin n=1 Tax=Dactylosporangium vinaceum TaxID=53362 RepID=A0ABV5MK03_9ACTN|nr:type VII secretion-associated serine protease mycosin [Dactylosporangium vinaceum]UAB92737.1 type VII secretion-associated serine protease mycosin [Dactylosporangium vinaceum]
MRPASLLMAVTVTLVALLGPAAPALAGAGGAVPARLYAANNCGQARSDKLTETPWPLLRLRPATAWQLSRGAGVTVAVIDSGVSDQHPKLAGKVFPGKDYTGGTDATCDAVGHGTVVAAIIAGRDTPDATFSGIAPDAQILPLRVLAGKDTNDPREPAIVAQAIRDAITANVQVINLSLEIRNPTQELADAVKSAIDHKIVVVAAAGNEGAAASNGQPVFPAAYPGVIAVAGTDRQDQRVATSSSGDFVDVAAPGVDIIGPAPRGGGFGLLEQGGTSFAAAYVSGVAALIKSYNPDLTPYDVTQRVRRTADHPPQGSNDQVGFGVVNPYEAVASVYKSVRSAEAAPPGRLTSPKDRVDSEASLRRAAWAIAAGALLLAVLVLLAAPVLRRGRARQWRAGRAAGPAGPAPAKDGFQPVVGRPLSITATSGRRALDAPAGPGARVPQLGGADAHRGRTGRPG